MGRKHSVLILSAAMDDLRGIADYIARDYQALDPEILKSVLVHRLRDQEDFYAAALRFFN